MATLCAIVKVSKSGYYQWLKHAGKADKDYGDYLLIKNVFDKGKAKYGWRTVKMRLKRDQGVAMNHKKIIRIMKKYGLIAKVRRRNPYKMIMKKTQEHRTCENILNRAFTQTEPGRKLVTDITYLPFGQHIAYLSAVKDLASREIVGSDVSLHLTMSIAFNTVTSLQANPTLKLDQTLIHSDQGVHYTNPEYIRMINELNMVQSMSRKGNCIDNAPMESFFGHLKDEVDYKNCKTFAELKALIEQYIHYYNTERPQWELKKMTPVEYRDHLLSAN